MNLFDDLDPMFEPSTAVALENVAARVRQLRMRRRMTIAGSIGTFALVIALATTGFASGASGHTRVSVSNNSTTSSTTSPVPGLGGHKVSVKPGPPVTTTTGPAAAASHTAGSAAVRPNASTTPVQSSSARGATTGPTPPLPTPTTPTTVHVTPADLTVAFGVSHLTLQSGTRTNLSYVVTNVGGTTGYLYVDPCTTDNAQELWPAPRGLWPATIAPRGLCGVLDRIPVGPGQSERFTHVLVAGRFSGTTDIVPAYPGAVVFAPPELRLPAATTAAPRRSLAVTITPPATAPFTADRPTQVTVKPANEVLSPFTLSNNLPFAVAYTFIGPRTSPRTGSTVGGTMSSPTLPADGGCVATPDPQHFTIWNCTYTVPGNTTVPLRLNFWATNTLLPPSAVIDPPSSAPVLPLPPGTYVIPWNEIALRLVVT